MGKYFCKRVASAIPLLLVISFVVFMFIHIDPGDPARMQSQDRMQQRKM